MSINFDKIFSIVYLSIILIAIIGWFLVSSKNNINKNFQQFLIWVLIFTIISGGYAFWRDKLDGNNLLKEFHDKKLERHV